MNGFSDVTIGMKVIGCQNIFLVVGCGEDNHRNPAQRFIGFNLFQHLSPVHAGEIEIEQDQVGVGRASIDALASQKSHGVNPIFGDMKLLGEIYRPDVSCVPIGDRYTMGPELATRAAEMIGAKVAIPIHYKTFPILVQDALGFRPKGIEVKELSPGETWRLA